MKWMSDECFEEQLKCVLRIVDEWYDAFSGSPGFALLTESQKGDAGAVTDFFARYTYEYLGLQPREWNAAAVRECLTNILPRKVSAGLPFFESVAPVLTRFFTFLEEYGLLPCGGKLGEAAKNSHQDIIAAAGDRRNWGPAKNFVMAAHDAGVDTQDPKALEAFMLQFNRRQTAMQAKSSDAIRTGSPRQPAFGGKAPHSWTNVEPYALCPCGSGRKFKFCCRRAFNSAQCGRPDGEQPQTEWNRPAGDDEPPFITEVIPDLDDEVDQVLRQLESGAGKAVEPRIKYLLKTHPSYHMTNYAMGIYLGMVANNPQGALPFFKKAVETFPPFPEAHFNLGTAAMKTCDIPKAVAAFRASVRYSKKGDGIAEKAREQLQFLDKTLLKGTAFKNLDAYLANAKLFDAAFQCLADFQFDQAVEMFKRVLDEFPDHVQSYGNLALAYAGLGKKAIAMECLEKALALDPSYEPARTNRCVLDAMREGEPFIPGGIREVNYYADRLNHKPGVES